MPRVAPAGRLDAARALALVPPVPRQEHGIRNRIAQLEETAGWRRAVGSLAPPDRSSDVPEQPLALAAVLTAIDLDA